MNTFKNSRAIITTAVMVVCLLWLTYAMLKKDSFEGVLDDEKLRSELLLSEKLLIEKDLQRSNELALSLRDKNRDLDHLLRTASAKLDSLNADNSKMKKENASLVEIKRRRAELIAMQSHLQNELQTLKTSYEELEGKNKEMESTVAFLQERNRLLVDDLNRSMFAAVDGSLIQAVKRKNQKLTVKAGRTRKLIATFDVPSNYKDLSYRIVDSNGNVFSTKNGTITSASMPVAADYSASSDKVVKGSELQKIEMTYIPDEKLKAGVYLIEISNENLYLGRLKVRLD